MTRELKSIRGWQERKLRVPMLAPEDSKDQGGDPRTHTGVVGQRTWLGCVRGFGEFCSLPGTHTQSGHVEETRSSADCAWAMPPFSKVTWRWQPRPSTPHSVQVLMVPAPGLCFGTEMNLRQLLSCKCLWFLVPCPVI